MIGHSPAKLRAYNFLKRIETKWRQWYNCHIESAQNEVFNYNSSQLESGGKIGRTMRKDKENGTLRYIE